MSDELMNVEDDGPVVAASDPAPAPVLAAAEPAPGNPDLPEPEAEDDPTTVDLKDIPKVSGLLSELKRERESNKQLKGQAARATELEAQVNELRPWAEFLRANPDLLKPRQQPQATVQAPTEAPVDPEAEAMARMLDLYTPEGKPDLARAGQMLKLLDSKVERRTRQVVAPVYERGYQDASIRNFQAALEFKDPSGRSPSKESLSAIWRTMTAQQTSDPQIASVLTMTALGMDAVNRKATPAAPAQAPIVTEGAGGAPRRASLSALEASVARDRGVADSKWADLTKGFVSGRSQQLED